MYISSPKAASKSARRRGKALYLTIAAIGCVACIALAAWMLTRRGKVADYEEYLTTTVWKGPFDFAVIEQGTLESASNTEIRCQVRSRGTGTAIIDVIPEGTLVKPGDILVELDSSNLKLEENAQQILVSTRKSQFATAENNLRAAQIAKTEYLDGLYVSQEKLLLSELFLAEQAKATAESAFASAKALHVKLIITGLQVEAAQAALEDANNKHECAKINLSTLRNLTKQKELTLLEASLASAEAEVKAQQQSLRLEEDRLKEIQDQVAKCTIRATTPGQVVYANETDYRGGMQFLVAPGAVVRERQVIIWLPNADDMQVKATVNEARVTMVRPGMPVTVRVDALKDELIEGVVTKVNQFAEQSSFFSGSVRKYATYIKIKNPPPELRVGMNAEVRIHVERDAVALQLPVQALAETKGHYFTLVKKNDDFETREIEIGSTNDKVATIRKGLTEGDEVIMNPRSAGDLLQLPDLPDPTPLAFSDLRPAELAATDVVAQYLRNDINKDNKLSRDEIANLEVRVQQRLLSADTNGDGFLERRELLTAADNIAQQSRETIKTNSAAPPKDDSPRSRDPRRTTNSETAGGG